MSKNVKVNLTNQAKKCNCVINSKEPRTEGGRTSFGDHIIDKTPVISFEWAHSVEKVNNLVISHRGWSSLQGLLHMRYSYRLDYGLIYIFRFPALDFGQRLNYMSKWCCNFISVKYIYIWSYIFAPNGPQNDIHRAEGHLNSKLIHMTNKRSVQRKGTF